ncbi:MAG: hypothetical protein ACRD21_15780 [Vicinamibacteria bacterium]
MKIIQALILAVLASSLLPGCDGSPTDADGSDFVVFTDSATGFATTDVRDVDDEIVRFIPADDTMLWVPGNLLFDNWPVDGSFLGPSREFQVRYGTVSGQRRAYFTEAGRGTLCDLQVNGNNLQLLPTNVLPPQ